MTTTLHLPSPGLIPAMTLSVDVGEAQDVGWVNSAHGSGRRRVVPILGGHARCVHPSGQWQARILPAGADFQLLTQDGVACLNARYLLETDAGDLIYVDSTAIRHGPPDVIARLLAGDAVDPAQVYFRCQPRFETQQNSLRWLNESLFLGSGTRQPTDVYLEIYAIT